MRVALKFTAALIVGITLVMIANTLVRVHREVALFEDDQEHDQHVMGRTLRHAVQAVWATEDEARARALVSMTNTHEFGVRLVTLDQLPEDDGTVRDDAGTPVPLRELLSAGKEATLVRHGPGGDRRYSYFPMTPPHGPLEALELSEIASPPKSFIHASVAENVLSTSLIVLVCGLIATTLGFWLIGRPMRLLAAKARRVGAGDFAGPLALRQRDEIGALAAEIDVTSARLAEAQARVAAETEARIAALEQLRHADRLKTIGQLASGVAHELGTPLNVISGRAGMIAADPTPATSVEGSRIIVAQTERMARIIRKLLDFSRRRGPQLVRHDLDRVVAAAVEILTPLAKARRVTLAVDVNNTVTAAVDPDQLLQALTNLMVNGMQAMPGGGRLAITVTHRRARPPADYPGGEGAYACMSVADEGEGIAGEALPHVFEPFFTTKGVGEGTGLGLSVAWGIVQEHGGWIDVRSERGHGSEFSILLPEVAA
jgi:signal transduction histidine kinase